MSMTDSRSLRRLLLLLAFAISCFSQVDQGQLAGTVKDNSDSVVPRATVTVVNTASGRSATAATGENGAFIFTNLLIGTYDVTVEASGFKKALQKNVKIDAASRASLEILMEIGAVSEAVTVNESFVQLQRESAQIGRIVESRQITDLALNGRNPIYLTSLKAGVIGGGNINDFNPTQMHEAFEINGGRRHGNNVTVDGVNAVRTRGDLNGMAQLGVFNADAVQEVQILATTYPAEYGRGMDGQIRLITKSGTRDFHGSAFYYFRNSVLDANSWTRNQSPVFNDNRRASPFRFNQPGFTVGGPVFLPGKFNTNRDKLFFFASTEFMAFRREKTSTGIVPTAAMRAGDFSELLSPSNQFFGAVKTIRDPLSGLPFPGNIIPQDRLSKNGVGLLNSYPLPTAGFRQGANNWISSLANPRDSKKLSFRVDYYATSKHRLNFGGSYFTYQEDDPFNGTFGLANSRWDRPNMTGVISLASTLSPTLVNEVSFSAAQEIVRIGIYGEAFRRGQYGQTFPYVLSGNKIIPDRVATVDITGFSTVDGSSRPVNSSGPMYNLSDNLTWIKNSAHTFKFGGWFGRDAQNNNDQVFMQNGRFAFLDTGHPQTTGVAIGNTALGYFDTYREIGQAAYTLLRSNTLEAYAQDTWKVRPNLTLEIGVRYSNHQPWYAVWNDIANFDPRFYDPAKRANVDRTIGYITSGDPYNGIVLPGTSYPDSAAGRANGASLPNVGRLFHDLPRGFVDGYNNAFAPRLGIAWQVGRKTVIRTGAGIFHHRHMATQTALFRNAPNQVQITVNQGFADVPGGIGARTYPFNVAAIDAAYKYPTAYSWSFSIQNELPGAIVLETAYVGKSGVNQERFRNFNQLLPGTRQANPGVNVDFLRPWHGLSSFNYLTHDGRTGYHGLQISADRRFRNGFAFGFAYTFSKTLDNTINPPDGYNYMKARDPQDRPHILNFNYIYELPFLRQSKGIVRAVGGGWQISGVTFVRSGRVLSVTDGTDVAGVGPGSGAQPWDVVRDPAYSGETGVGKLWFDKDAFQVPANGKFGNAGLNILRGPKFMNWDVALFKNLRITERLNSQFRFEMFNFPNHPLLSDPNLNPRTPSTFGLVTAKYAERNIQFGLKFLF